MKLTDITSAIKSRLGIDALNDIQQSMASSANQGTIVLLAPTGSGKTLAFSISLLMSIDKPDGKVQAVVLAPSRELVLQIYDVLRPIATNLKTTALYGGHSMDAEAKSLTVTPDIIVATPGRLLDHINRRQVDLSTVRTLVLDEYDKALELGFADEMSKISRRIPSPTSVILTSATRLDVLPQWLPGKPVKPIVLDHTDRNSQPRGRMQVVEVNSPQRDKLQSLIDLLATLPEGSKTMVFTGHRESAERIFNALLKQGFPAGLYHGGLEQNERENALEMLVNGTTPILVTTDLGARGLDISGGVDQVVHYHMPVNQQTWTHRNGRTARVDASGTVYVITSETDDIPDYIDWDRSYCPPAISKSPAKSNIATLYLNVGKKDKISRGDIVGYLIAKGRLAAQEIGRISLRDHSALVAIPASKASSTVECLKNQKVKNTRVKVSELLIRVKRIDNICTSRY